MHDGFVVRDPNTGNLYASTPENVGNAEIVRPLRPYETVQSFVHKPGLKPAPTKKEAQ